MNPDYNQIKELLEQKYLDYCRTDFIEGDPISIPHLFNQKEDIEIAAFLTATISWGNRKSIIQSANYLMKLLDYRPYEYTIQSGKDDLKALESFKHRTFNGTDIKYFIESLKNIYMNYGGIEKAFNKPADDEIKSSIIHFRHIFFSLPFPARTAKHLADPSAGASAKRINMFLRWMVRNDGHGVDFGIWNSVSPASLYCPLDIHTGDVARKLGLLNRRQNDWKALEELMVHLRIFDPQDPVKYDFALFGLGIFEKF